MFRAPRGARCALPVSRTVRSVQLTPTGAFTRAPAAPTDCEAMEVEEATATSETVKSVALVEEQQSAADAALKERIVALQDKISTDDATIVMLEEELVRHERAKKMLKLLKRRMRKIEREHHEQRKIKAEMQAAAAEAKANAAVKAKAKKRQKALVKKQQKAAAAAANGALASEIVVEHKSLDGNVNELSQKNGALVKKLEQAQTKEHLLHSEIPCLEPSIHHTQEAVQEDPTNIQMLQQTIDELQKTNKYLTEMNTRLDVEAKKARHAAEKAEKERSTAEMIERVTALQLEKERHSLHSLEAEMNESAEHVRALKDELLSAEAAATNATAKEEQGAVNAEEEDVAHVSSKRKQLSGAQKNARKRRKY